MQAYPIASQKARRSSLPIMSLPGFLGSIVGHSRRLLKFEIRCVSGPVLSFKDTNGFFFDGRPEVKFVVMPGPVGDTADYVLRGHVVLMNSEAIQTKGATIVLEGKRRTAWVERGRPDDHWYPAEEVPDSLRLLK